MIKECKVILHNSEVTVFVYDGKSVQIPSTENKGTLYVNFENGRYSIVTKDNFEKSKKRTKFQRVIDNEDVKE